VSRLLVALGIHAPACADIDAHIDAAVHESAGTFMPLDEFIANVRADWQDEQLMADAGDQVVIDYWRAVERDFMQLQGAE
jgi:hypothetical protein